MSGVAADEALKAVLKVAKGDEHISVLALVEYPDGATLKQRESSVQAYLKFLDAEGVDVVVQSMPFSNIVKLEGVVQKIIRALDNRYLVTSCINGDLDFELL